MRSRYFAIETLSGEKMMAQSSSMMTSSEFLMAFMDIAKEAKAISYEEYKAGTGDE